MAWFNPLPFQKETNIQKCSLHHALPFLQFQVYKRLSRFRQVICSIYLQTQQVTTYQCTAAKITNRQIREPLQFILIWVKANFQNCRKSRIITKTCSKSSRNLKKIHSRIYSLYTRTQISIKNYQICLAKNNMIFSRTRTIYQASHSTYTHFPH